MKHASIALAAVVLVASFGAWSAIRTRSEPQVSSVPDGGLRPFVIVAHARGTPSTLASAMTSRGLAVATVTFSAEDAGASPTALAREIAPRVREMIAHARSQGLAPPVLAGSDRGAAAVAELALDAAHGIARESISGIVALNGVPSAAARADAPAFLVVSSHGEPAAAVGARAFANALERAGSKNVHHHHVSGDAADLVASFVRGEPHPAGAESPWAIQDAWWRANAPLSSEGFWKDERLVVRRPVDARLRNQVRRLFADALNEIDPWPGLTYDAIDLGAWLDAHPEHGKGAFITVENARGERLVLTRKEIGEKKPVIVVGLDDERNLFRVLVTYNVYRTYSWKPETEPRPLLVRSLGAFLHLPEGPSERLDVTTFADFALTPESFRASENDPLAQARKFPAPLASALTGKEGCVQCHSFRGTGARAHHLRAVDGKAHGGFALPLEEYPRDVLERFLFDQESVAKSFGVGPLVLDKAIAKDLLSAVVTVPAR